MSKRASSAQLDLGYPPWALDFDPYNRGYLLLSGGGGEGQKEVPNRLTLLNISSEQAVERVAELATSIEEDCPVSLAVLPTKDGLSAYVGLNSGSAERQKGVNKHFRSFRIDLPVRTKTKSGKPAQGKIVPISKTSLFSSSFASGDDGAFQRLLRLSQPKKSSPDGKRIGAIASSLSKDSEIIIFDATNNSSSNSVDVLQTIKPLQNAEANDIDIFETPDGLFLIAFCTNTEIYVSILNYDSLKRKFKKPVGEPKSVYSVPVPDAFQRPGRPRIRSLRFLTSRHLLILSNRGSQSELQILAIYPDGGEGLCLLRKQLPVRMGAAVSMDVCLLDADVETGARQIIVAVAAQAQDVQVYTLEYSGPSKDTLSPFNLYLDWRNLHTMAMKKVVLEPFQTVGLSPVISSPKKKKKRSASSSGLRSIHLASISLANTVVVETLPLQPLHSSKSGSRYVLTKRSGLSESLPKYGTLSVIGFGLVFLLLFLQSFLQARAAGDNPSLGLIPQSLQNYLGFQGQRASNITNAYIHKAEKIADQDLRYVSVNHVRDLLHLHHNNRNLPDSDKKAIVIRAAEDGSDELSTEVHANPADVLKKDTAAKKWEDLTKRQQQQWKERLVKAGEWVESEGETILKGVFFSEFAGAVGQAAAEALAG